VTFLLLFCILISFAQCRKNEGDYSNDAFDNNLSGEKYSSQKPVTTPVKIKLNKDLSEVQHWFYYLGFSAENAVFDQIAASTYDLIVIEPIFTEKDNSDFDITGILNRMHLSAHPKIVLAYIDIGQAEEWRSYWQPKWQIRNPDWILGEDPDGWEGNYPVAYWHLDWQNIWLQENGLLEKLMAAGFDGIYLDWIEGYSDDNVLSAAEKAGIDAEQEMIEWVRKLSARCKMINTECLVVAQNATALLIYSDYRQAIDAIAQEQIWFDGGAENEPPGDCHLPRTDDDIESEAYIAGLNNVCRQQYFSCPDGTLHTSSAFYLENLQYADQYGLPVFTVDYALLPENIAWAHDISRSLGYKPFVGERNLSTYIPPYLP